MPIKWNEIAWIQIIVTALIAYLSSIAFYYFTNRAPDLVFEQIAPAHFTSRDVRIGIYGAQVENIGDKEVEDVEVHVDFPQLDGTATSSIAVKTSLKSMAYSIEHNDEDGSRIIKFPLMNPKEGASIAVMLGSSERHDFRIEVRGKGITGRPRAESDK